MAREGDGGSLEVVGTGKRVSHILHITVWPASLQLRCTGKLRSPHPSLQNTVNAVADDTGAGRGKGQAEFGNKSKIPFDNRKASS